MVAGSTAFVAGGAEIYRQFLPLASKLFLTRVHGTYDGDTHFPEFDRNAWTLVSTEPGESSGPGPSITFEIYERAPA
jgi:dihydrofolate reductase